MSVLDNTNEQLDVIRDPSGVISTATPVLESGPEIPDAPAPRTQLSREIQQFSEPSRFGQFVPQGLGTPQGDFGGAVQSGWREGLIGFLTRPEGQSLAEQDRLSTEGANYAEEHGIKNFLGTVIGGAASDAPIEIGLVLTGAPLLGSLSKATARRGMVGASRRFEEAAEFMRQAERGDVGALDMAKYASTLGALTGVTSESGQQLAGKEGTLTDIIRRGSEDAVGSVLFGEALRLGKKVFKNFTQKDLESDIKNSAQTEPVVAPDPVESVVPEVQPEQPTAPLLDAGLIDVSRRLEAPDNFASTIESYNKNKTGSGLRDVLVASFPEDATGMVDNVISFMTARADAARMDLDEYLKRKNIEFSESSNNRVFTEFDEFKQTINAIENATTVDQFIHELGHIYRSDIPEAHVKTIDSQYGVKDGNWTREAEEAFAEDFLSWVRSGDESSGFPRKLRRAFQALADWFKNTLGVLVGQGVDTSRVAPEVAEAFGSLFDTDTGAPLDIDAEARVFQQREAAGTTQLFAPDDEEFDTGITQEFQQASAEIVREAHSEETGVVSGKWNPVTPIAKKFWEAFKRSGIFGVDNMSLLDTYEGLGATFNNQILQPMKDALDVSSDVKVRMTEGFKEMNISNEQHRDFSKSKKMTLGGKDVNITGLERISLYLAMTDGTTPDFEWNGRATAGYSRLVEHKTKKGKDAKISGADIDGKVVRFSREEAEDLVFGDKLLSPDEKKIVDQFHSIYAENVPWINEQYQLMTGKNLVDGSYRYSPLKSVAEEGEQEFDDLVGFDDILKFRGKSGERINIAGSLQKRGTRKVQLADPFESANRYINTVPDSVAFAAPAKVALDSLDANNPAGTNRKFMVDTYGKDMYDNTVNLTRNLVGDRSGFKRSRSPIGSYVINLANLSKLSLNFTSALKQWGSIGTAKATKILPDMNAAKVWSDAVRLAVDEPRRKELLEEAAEEVPFFAFRQLGGVRFVDADEFLSSSDFARLVMTREGEPTAKEILDLAKSKDITKSSAWAEMVSRGLFMIKKADESAMAALWIAVKESGKEPNATFRDLILESQPSYDNLSRSTNQLNRDLLSRSLAAFSTQTRKNAAMFNKMTFNLANTKNPTMDDVLAYLDDIAPLVYQTAYTTAMGATGAVITGKALGLLEGEKTAERNANLREQGAEKLMLKFTQDLVGQQPVAGALASYMLARTFGGPAFKTELIGFREAQDIMDAITASDGRAIERLIRAFSGVAGSTTAGKVLAAPLTP